MPLLLLRFSIGSMLGLVACVAANLALFRLDLTLGFVSLYATKHVVIAQLCQAVGLNRGRRPLERANRRP